MNMFTLVKIRSMQKNRYGILKVMENGSNKTVMLVNAETGKEINLPS